MTAYIDWIDYTVFSALLILSTGIGVYFAFFAKEKQNTTAEYLLGGKTMGIFPISMSLIASYISGISVLGLPAEMYVYGTQYWLIVIPEILVSFTMAFVYIPVFYKLQITSSYEYLRLRFNKKVRTLGSCLFIIKMLLYIPIVVYVPALAFSQVTGINLHLITPIVCTVCIFYTSLGGLKAVVWTDTVQVMMMLAAIGIVMVIGVLNVGGLSEVLKRNLESGRIEFDVFDPDPRVRHSVWGVVIGNYFYWLASCSVNQMMVQRCLAMPTRTKANMTIANLAIGIIILVAMCCFTGLVVFAYYYHCDPLLSKKIEKSDQILPYFVMEVGSSVPGLPGLFVSGVFSAALSTMSTGLNSLTGVIFQDLIKPVLKRDLSEATSSCIMKVIAASIGVLCVALVFLVEKLGALIQAGKSLGGITAGPLLGLFSLGMFFPWANAQGALIGGISGVLVTGCLSIFSQLAIAKGLIRYQTKPFSIEGCDPPTNLTFSYPPSNSESVAWVLQLSYMWYTLIGVTTVISVGMVVSYFTGFNSAAEVNKDLLTPVIYRYLPQKKREKQCLKNIISKETEPPEVQRKEKPS
ncbi:unnamed protein product [Nezara viridula]|uniref:Sodium-coupled monocarboxylate transporter 1-like n=1 Tax=Nezara viridula TaxID=85310 RepID=A0A9P0HTG5_NEZVI|nr:unnamed protein product [Nezara viridula]